MHCKQLDKTTWVCVIDAPRDYASGKRKQISRRGTTKKEAERKALDALEELKTQIDINKKITFEDFCEIWFKNYANRGVKKSTLEQKKYCVGKLISKFGKMQLNKITPIFYQNILNELNENLSNSTMKSIHNAMQLIFVYALQVGVIEKNITEGTFIPKSPDVFSDVDAVEKLYLNKEELKLFLKVLDGYKSIAVKTVLYLIAFTGMRPGEALVLQTKDIDFEENTININKTMFRKNGIKGDFEITPPKTKAATRVIDVDPLIMNKIREMQDFQYLNYKDSDFVFRLNDGMPCTVDYLRTVVGKLGIRAGIKKPCHTYMLRHTHISLLAEAEVDLAYVMARVGHKNATTTTQIYTHITKGMRKKSMIKLHNKFTEILDSE